MTRVRLDTDERREQLLHAGVEMLGTRAADGLSIGAVAKAAGVSKGLLYHYFRDKEQFFDAVVRAAGDELLAATEPDLELPPLERVRGVIDGLITFAEGHATGYLAIFQGDLHIAGAAEQIKLIRERRVESIIEQIAEAGTADPDVVRKSPSLRIALSGQFAFMQASVLNWLEHRDIDRETLLRLLLRSFFMTMTAVASVEPQLRFGSIGRIEDVMTV